MTRYTAEAAPAGHLVFPLIVASVVSVMTGVAAAFSSKRWIAAVAVTLFIPSRIALIAVLLGVAVWYGARIAGKPFNPAGHAFVASVAMAVVGIVSAAPLMWTVPEPEGIEPPGPAQYLILLDGYPRIDSLALVGIDNQPFIDALAERGFDHYAEAESLHSWTQLTLLAMTGTVLDDDPIAAGSESWSMNQQLRLPDGWVAVAPPFGDATLRTPNIGKAPGLTSFGINLLRETPAALVPGVDDWIMDRLRVQTELAIDTIASTEHTRVFAHIAAPHLPYLWGPEGPADVSCWPCNIFWSTPGEGWKTRLAATVDHVNERVLETVDNILEKRPNATIVVFSDHGGRFWLDYKDEWRRSFLVARTPRRAGLFAETPRPDQIMALLSGR